MHLEIGLFLKLTICYLILSCIRIVNSRHYSQSEIDDAFKKVISIRNQYLPVEKKLGCWPNNLIPYTITDGFNEKQITHIKERIQQYHSLTCVRWMKMDKLSNPQKFVKFTPSTTWGECKTSERHQRNSQGRSIVVVTITLDDTCFIEENVIHEMMHALGFPHEHQRVDRDCYVTVDDDSDLPAHARKIIYDDLTFEKWPYDKKSVMHYRREGGGIKDKNETFWTKVFTPWRYRLGDSNGYIFASHQGQLSYFDRAKIHYRYCGAPDYCDVKRKLCEDIDKEEINAGCKELYMGMANGTFKRSPRE